MWIIGGFLLVVVGQFVLNTRRFKLLEKTTRRAIFYKATFLFYVAMGCFFFYLGYWRIASPLNYEPIFGVNGLLITWGMALFYTIFVFASFIRDMFFARKVA